MVETQLKKQRVWELDLCRAVLIVLSIVDHFFKVTNYFNVFRVFFGDETTPLLNLYYTLKAAYETPVLQRLQPLVLALFFFVSGASCVFCKNDLKRFLRFAVVAVALHVVWLLGKAFVPLDINYGSHFFNFVLMFAVSYGVWWLLKDVLHVQTKSIALVSAVFAGVGIVAMACHMSGETWTFDVRWAWLPVVYSNLMSFSPMNFVPLLPEVPLFCLGGAVGFAVYKQKTSVFGAKPKWLSPLCWVGRHSLLCFFCVPPLLLLLVAALVACGI